MCVGVIKDTWEKLSYLLWYGVSGYVVCLEVRMAKPRRSI